MQKYIHQSIDTNFSLPLLPLFLALLLFPVRLTLLALQFILRYSWKILFYGGLFLLISTGLLLLCSLYVLTLGTLHIP